MSTQWKYLVAGYYNDDVKPPKRPGGLAVEVGCATESVRDMEIRAFAARRDIGDVTVNGFPIDKATD